MNYSTLRNNVTTILLLSLILISVFVSGCIYASYFWERKYGLTELECYEFCENLVKEDIHSCERELLHQNETHGLCICKCMKSGFGFPPEEVLK